MFQFEDYPEKPNSKMKRRRRLWVTFGQLILGFIFILGGSIIFLKFETIYDMILNKAMEFTPDSEPFRVWRKNDPPLIMDVYLFNWTNPEDIETPGVKPKLEEIGPYRFKEVKEKTNITWNDNKTISYMHKKSYYFDKENSVRNLSDVITTLNAVPLTLAYKVRNLGYFTKKMVSLALSGISAKIHVTQTAGEILFDGYEDDILNILKHLPIEAQERFGIFYGKNDTIGTDGKFVMSTENDDTFGKLLLWNGRNQTDFYSGECNSVRGSAGEFYPINRKKDYIELYSSELCKYAKLEYEKDVQIKGVFGYKYTAKHIFDNGTRRIENACFCKGECIPSGVLNVSSCRLDSPSFLSMPHFYNADPYYTEAVEGMRPLPRHEFYATMQPKSGILMDISAKMQLNFLLQPYNEISLYRHVPRVFFPIFYFDQDVRLKDELAENLLMIQNLPEYANYLALILVTLGFLNIAWAVCTVFNCRRTKLTQTLHSSEEVPLQKGIKQIT